MSTETNINITVADIPVEVVKKDIKNLHIGVYPPDGRVRVAAPAEMSDDAIRLAVINRLGWIKRQIHGYQNQAREAEHELASGESHYYLGQRYRLDVIEQDKPRKVEVKGKTIMTLHVRPGDTLEQKEKTLHRWYRDRLHELVSPLVEKWEQKLGVDSIDLTIQRMKTRWGSCIPKERKILINLELAKQPNHLIEYVVVHELAHLVEGSHNEHFEDILDRELPTWRSLKQELSNSRAARYNFKDEG